MTLEIEKTTGPSVSGPGSYITSLVRVKNNGTTTANNVIITDDMPTNIPGLTRTWSATETGGVIGLFASGTGNINQTLTMPPGSEVKFTVADYVPLTFIGHEFYSNMVCVQCNCAPVCVRGDTVQVRNDIGCVFIPPGQSDCDYLAAMRANGLLIGCRPDDVESVNCIDPCRMVIPWRQAVVNSAPSAFAPGVVGDATWQGRTEFTLTANCPVIMMGDISDSNSAFQDTAQNGVIWRYEIDGVLHTKTMPGSVYTIGVDSGVKGIPMKALAAGTHTFAIEYKRVGTVGTRKSYWGIWYFTEAC